MNQLPLLYPQIDTTLNSAWVDATPSDTPFPYQDYSSKVSALGSATSTTSSWSNYETQNRNSGTNFISSPSKYHSQQQQYQQPTLQHYPLLSAYQNAGTPSPSSSSFYSNGNSMPHSDYFNRSGNPHSSFLSNHLTSQGSRPLPGYTAAPGLQENTPLPTPQTPPLSNLFAEKLDHRYPGDFSMQKSFSSSDILSYPLSGLNEVSNVGAGLMPSRLIKERVHSLSALNTTAQSNDSVSSHVPPILLPSPRIKRTSTSARKSSSASNEKIIRDTLENLPVVPHNPTVQITKSQTQETITFPYKKQKQVSMYQITLPVTLSEHQIPELLQQFQIPHSFKVTNAVYPNALVPEDQYTGKRQSYEMSVNELGWVITWYNRQILDGKKGVIQRAVDHWRNSRGDLGLMSRRARKRVVIKGRKNGGKRI